MIKKKAKAFYKVAWDEQYKRFKLKDLEKASLKVDEAFDTLSSKKRQDSINFVKWIKINRKLSSGRGFKNNLKSYADQLTDGVSTGRSRAQEDSAFVFPDESDAAS